MKEYLVNPVPFIVQSVFMTFTLGVIALGSLSTGAPEKIVVGIFCLLVLALFYCWAVFQVKTPAVRIEGNSVTVRGIFGRAIKIDDVKSCYLVVSNTWIGFRRAGHQDVVIDSGRFSTPTWQDMGEQIRKLAMAGMGVPLPAQPPARWVIPTLIFFCALFILAGVDELVTGSAGTSLGSLLIGGVILLIARQQWRLRRTALAEMERRTTNAQ